jgi:hypothetical protein
MYNFVFLTTLMYIAFFFSSIVLVLYSTRSKTPNGTITGEESGGIQPRLTPSHCYLLYKSMELISLS